jgi:hypothetical protein
MDEMTFAANATPCTPIVGYQPRRLWRLPDSSRYRHNDLGSRNLLIVIRRDGHLNCSKKSLASLRELPAGVIPQHVARAKYIEIRREC